MLTIAILLDLRYKDDWVRLLASDSTQFQAFQGFIVQLLKLTETLRYPIPSVFGM